MYYLIEDPSYLLIGLGVAALGCLLALRVTQQGKFLIWAGVLAAVAGLVFVADQYWVTDAERVEGVVYDLARAVEASDSDRIKSHMDERVSIGMRGARWMGRRCWGWSCRCSGTPTSTSCGSRS